MNIDPSTTKYMIQARMEAEGIVEKPDVVGAVFGQTEGLLGEELDLRDLQKGGRIGRIEVDVQSKKGRSEGLIYIPSSLDQVETSILAAALETIDRVGPCKATIKVEKVEDVRVTKRNKIIERARALLSSMVEESKTSGTDLLDEVRQSVQVSEIVSFGPERLPSGPNVSDSDAIIIVEGGQVYKPETEFPEAKNVGPAPAPGRFDRGGEPRPESRPEPRDVREAPPAPLTPTTKALNPKLEKYRDMLLQLGGSSTARLLDEGDGVVTEVPVRELVDTLKTKKQTRAIVFDGIITQRILDIAAEMNMHSVVGTKMGTITKQPAGVVVWTRSDLAP